jgi:DNA-binding FadR family transcriptional regulator
MARPIRPPAIYPTAEAVLHYLSARVDDTGIAIASRAEIATAIGVSEISARKALRRLEYLGSIAIQYNTGPTGQALANTIRLKGE